MAVETGRRQSAPSWADGAELEHGAMLQGPCLEAEAGGMASLPDPATLMLSVTQPILSCL